MSFHMCIPGKCVPLITIINIMNYIYHLPPKRKFFLSPFVFHCPCSPVTFDLSATIDYFIFSRILCRWNHYSKHSFLSGVFSLSKIILRFIQFLVCISSLLRFIGEWYVPLCRYTTISLSAHLFPVWGFYKKYKKTAVSVHIQVFVVSCAFISFG